jgi:hypothetical protein
MRWPRISRIKSSHELHEFHENHLVQFVACFWGVSVGLDALEEPGRTLRKSEQIGAQLRNEVTKRQPCDKGRQQNDHHHGDGGGRVTAE